MKEKKNGDRDQKEEHGALAPDGANPAEAAFKRALLAIKRTSQGTGESPSIETHLDYMVGWRAWRVQNGRLYSIVRSYQWPVKEPLVAECAIHKEIEQLKQQGYDPRVRYPAVVLRPHVAPDPDCTCGIYAVLKENVWPYHAQAGMAPWIGATSSLVGKVALWGKIEEYTGGFKAQYAYPLELFHDGEYPMGLLDYGVPINPRSGLDIKREAIYKVKGAVAAQTSGYSKSVIMKRKKWYNKPPSEGVVLAILYTLLVLSASTTILGLVIFILGVLGGFK